MRLWAQNSTLGLPSLKMIWWTILESAWSQMIQRRLKSQVWWQKSRYHLDKHQLNQHHKLQHHFKQPYSHYKPLGLEVEVSTVSTWHVEASIITSLNWIDVSYFFFQVFLFFFDRNSRLQSWAHQVQAALSQCQARPQQPAARPRDTMWLDPSHFCSLQPEPYVAGPPGFLGTSTTTSTATMTSTTASWHLLERIRKSMAWNQWLSSGESWVLSDWNECRYHWYNMYVYIYNIYMCVYRYISAGLHLADT